MVPLCRLDVGSARHRALLFKVLADAAKLPCRLVRGAALCGSEAGVVVLVAVPAATGAGGGSRSGGEWVVDLVYEPGRLYGPQEYCALVKSKRTRELGPWYGGDQGVSERDGGLGMPAHVAPA